MIANQTPIAHPTTPSKAAGAEKKPRKNRSAYSLFALDVKPQLKAANGSKLTCVELQAAISSKWNSLSEEERKVYQDKAHEEKLCYMLKLKKFYENNNYEAVEETKPKAKRPYSGYCYFVKEIRQVIDLPDTKFKMQEILKQASEKWRNLSNDERAVYQEKARLAKERALDDSTDESEQNDSVKMEESAMSEISAKEVKVEKKVAKKDLNKKRSGINFSKEIQEKMDQLDREAAASKKVKTDEKSEAPKKAVETSENKESPASLLQEKSNAFFPSLVRPTPIVPTSESANPILDFANSIMAKQAQMARDVNLLMMYENMKRTIAAQMFQAQVAETAKAMEANKDDKSDKQ